MTIEQYLKYALKNRLPSKVEWIYSVFSKPLTDTAYIKIKDNKYFLVVDNALKEVTLNSSGSVFDVKDKVILNEKDLSNITNEIKTTVGRAIINYIILCVPFKDKIPYQNDTLDFGAIHDDIIITRLSDKDTPDTITIDEYNNFGISLSFIRSLAELFVISSTEKAILPPKGIKEFKEKTIKEFKKKYGDDVFKDKVRVSEFESILKEYDKEWLKDDPSYGISLSGKILNNSRKKRFLTFGSEDGILATEEATLVENSLLEGFPNDKKKLATMFNSARAGSYSRGKETQDSGVISDKLVRGLTGFKVIIEDCKTTKGKYFNVTKNNYISLIGRSKFINSKSIIIETEPEAKKLIGTTILLRSMLYCKSKNNTFCKLCAGRSISQTPNGITLISLDIGAAAMSSKLKKMHDSSLSVYDLTLDDLIN